jgi:hypothetical protein
VEAHKCGKSPRLKEIVGAPCLVASSATTCQMGSVLTIHVVRPRSVVTSRCRGMIGWFGSRVVTRGITSERSRLGLLFSISQSGDMDEGMIGSGGESAHPLES